VTAFPRRPYPWLHVERYRDPFGLDADCWVAAIRCPIPHGWRTVWEEEAPTWEAALAAGLSALRGEGT
jgi:hypothetical protein